MSLRHDLQHRQRRCSRSLKHHRSSLKWILGFKEVSETRITAAWMSVSGSFSAAASFCWEAPETSPSFPPTRAEDMMTEVLFLVSCSFKLWPDQMLGGVSQGLPCNSNETTSKNSAPVPLRAGSLFPAARRHSRRWGAYASHKPQRVVPSHLLLLSKPKLLIHPQFPAQRSPYVR